MVSSKLVFGAAAALAFGVAAPAFAQTTNANGNSNSKVSVDTTNKTSTFAPSNSGNTSVTKDTSLALSLTSNQTDNSQHNHTLNASYTDNSQRNGNIHLVADQTLDASITNKGTLNFNGKSADYASGANNVSGSAFAAYSGILNQGWNTGVNSNAQAATNIAAQGTTSFATH